MEILPDLSVIIRGEDDGLLSNCFQGLVDNVDPLALEIFIPHRFSSFVAQFPALNIIVLNKTPINDQEAFAVLLSQAKGRYLAVWPENARPAPGCLFNLIDYLDDNPVVGGLGPRIFTVNGRYLPTSHKDGILPSAVLWRSNMTTREVGWLHSPIVFNRLAVEDVGLPRQSLVNWQWEYCRRLRKKGWHIMVYHLARVVWYGEVFKSANILVRLADAFIALWPIRVNMGRSGNVS